LAKSFPNQQSHFPISKAVSQPAKLFAGQQSRLLTGRVIPQSAESFADQQSYSAISKIVSQSAKRFPDQRSRFLLGEDISLSAKLFPDRQSHFLVRKGGSRPAENIFSPPNSLGLNAIQSSASRNLHFHFRLRFSHRFYNAEGKRFGGNSGRGSSQNR
jgi:hypothetical protein